MSYTITVKHDGMWNYIEGTLNGKPFYFMARDGSWTLRVADPATMLEDGQVMASGVAHDGWPKEKSMALLEALLTNASDDGGPQIRNFKHFEAP